MQMKSMAIGRNTEPDKVYVIMRVSSLLSHDLVFKTYVDPIKPTSLHWTKRDGSFASQMTSPELKATDNSTTQPTLVRFDIAV